MFPNAAISSHRISMAGPHKTSYPKSLHSLLNDDDSQQGVYLPKLEHTLHYRTVDSNSNIPQVPKTPPLKNEPQSPPLPDEFSKSGHTEYANAQIRINSQKDSLNNNYQPGINPREYSGKDYQNSYPFRPIKMISLSKNHDPENIYSSAKDLLDLSSTAQKRLHSGSSLDEYSNHPNDDCHSYQSSRRNSNAPPFSNYPFTENPPQSPPPSNNSSSTPPSNINICSGPSSSSLNRFPVGSHEWQKVRRENHKQVERRRREHINAGVNLLSSLVPGCEKNKGKVLHQAAHYITQLKADNAARTAKYEAEINEYKLTISKLQDQINRLQN
ncbi:putative bHLH domain-containing protein [Smittium mucronatum]|uniref:Putative bHLH domain-containing protein n=1 Tax=Smittium mucronatum TaxID=133383 RepID=A0A1R0GPQ9_9FUNG|nr:putative bHLH domain-containing protein [Smittium mucronatum]